MSRWYGVGLLVWAISLGGASLSWANGCLIRRPPLVVIPPPFPVVAPLMSLARPIPFPVVASVVSRTPPAPAPFVVPPLGQTPVGQPLIGQESQAPAQPLPAPTPMAPPPMGQAPSTPPPSPQPAVPPRPPTLREFMTAFQPQPGNYEVVMLHPVTCTPVNVCFTLPPGCPSKVRVHKREVEFRYGGRHKVIIRFKLNGSVIVRYR